MLKQLIALFVLSVSLFAQSVDDQYFEKNGEVYFRFPVFNKLELQEITKIISIDKFDGKMVTAYANKDQFRKFQKTGYKVEVLPPPGDVPVEMGNPRALGLWDVYPSYETYVQMLNDLAADYPNLCRVVDAGTTTQGRKILFVVISDNVNVTEPEPRFMHSSSMHGDETAAFVNMIRLADHLLSNYNVDPLITKLVNGLEIWINPAANPDGTYRSGNATVTGARRGNANNVDINRNFPDPVQGQHPDGYAWQPETIAMMNLGNSTYFNMSANYHGGAEVVNYPWDSRSARHADDNWWQQVSRRYADTVHFYCNNNGYLSEFNNGITNGWDWYSVYGGRQDWFTYFKFGREVTIELSNTKLISASYIPTIWNYNRAAWLNLMNELLSGVGGVVKSPEGVPVKVKVTVLSHDHTNAEVFSDSISGAYTRMIFPGTYDLTFTAAGYDPVTVNGVVVSSGVKTPLDVTIYPVGWVPVELASFTSEAVSGGVKLLWSTATETNNFGFEVEMSLNGGEFTKVSETRGAGTSTESRFYEVIIPLSQNGVYDFRLKQIDLDGSFNYSNVINFENGVVRNFNLGQNYPNPFNSSTVLNFDLPVPSEVTVTIFSIEGREIEKRELGLLEAGNHSWRYEAENLVSGNYILRLNAGSFTASKKFTYLK